MAKYGTRNHILDRLRERVSGSASRRDINVVEHTIVGNNSAKIVAIYSGDIPTYEEVRNWAIDVTNNRLRIIAETLASYDTAPYPMISFIAELNEVRKPFAKAMEESSLVCVAKNMYLEEELGTTWEKRDIEGRAFLVRVEQDGIETLLQSVGNYVGPKTGKIAQQIVAMTAYPKDKVKYLRPDTTIGCGVVVSVDEKGFLTIKDDSSHNVYERPKATVLDVMQRGPESEKTKREVADYFATYLGKDLADSMFD